MRGDDARDGRRLALAALVLIDWAAIAQGSPIRTPPAGESGDGRPGRPWAGPGAESGQRFESGAGAGAGTKPGPFAPEAVFEGIGERLSTSAAVGEVPRAGDEPARGSIRAGAEVPASLATFPRGLEASSGPAAAPSSPGPTEAMSSGRPVPAEPNRPDAIGHPVQASGPRSGGPSSSPASSTPDRALAVDPSTASHHATVGAVSNGLADRGGVAGGAREVSTGRLEAGGAPAGPVGGSGAGSDRDATVGDPGRLGAQSIAVSGSGPGTLGDGSTGAIAAPSPVAGQVATVTVGPGPVAPDVATLIPTGDRSDSGTAGPSRDGDGPASGRPSADLDRQGIAAGPNGPASSTDPANEPAPAETPTADVSLVRPADLFATATPPPSAAELGAAASDLAGLGARSADPPDASPWPIPMVEPGRGTLPSPVPEPGTFAILLLGVLAGTTVRVARGGRRARDQGWSSLGAGGQDDCEVPTI